MTIEQVLARIEDQTERLRNVLAADPEFGNAITEIISTLLDEGLDVRIVVRRRDTLEELATYRAPAASEHTGAAPDHKEVASEDKATTSTVEAWPTRRTRLNIDTCMRQLGELTNLHWGDRDPMTLLPYLKSPGTQKRVLAYAAAQAGEQSVGVLHTDLDNFKKINTEFSEPHGDKVLAEFARRFRLHFADIGIVFRTGGEEFSAVIKHKNAVELFRRAERFRQSMQTEPLKTIERANTCSIGLAIYPEGDIDQICTRFDDLLDDARTAEKRAKDDGKNCIRLSGTQESRGLGLSAPALVRAAIEARVDLNRPVPAVLPGETRALLAEMIATELVGAVAGETSALVARAAQAIGLSFGQRPPAAAGKPRSIAAVIPIHEWAAAVAWAYLRSAYLGGKALAPDDVLKFEIVVDRETGASLFLAIDRGEKCLEKIFLVSVPCAEAVKSSVVVGKPWYSSSNLTSGRVVRWDVGEGTGVRSALSPCLLLPIGDTATSLAKRMQHLVADIVEIDDRPVIGGGLPDFWQSNVSRIIRACLRNPNIKTIVAMGRADNAMATLARLKLGDETWSRNIHDLQRRLSISSENLKIFRDRAISVVSIEEPADETILKAILDATLALVPITATPIVVDLDIETRRRRLPIPLPSEANRLLVTDGLRTRTLADAYPQAINLLRANDSVPQIETTLRRFREFPCFKLVLTTPFIETVPDYWKGEEEALDHYFETNFGRQNGLFGAPLHAAIDGGPSLYDLGIKATLLALRDERPTRRIQLPVNSSNSRFDQPLGLCAIQVMPRLRDGRWYVDFQWVWRTVEALVGLPFSAYGSITWSKRFFENVVEDMRRCSLPNSVELGELTYLALSFHMFLDVGDTEIARAIVQDVSH